MGLIELIIVVLVILWLFGFFGRGRWYATGTGTAGTTAGWSSGGWIHTLIVLAVILLLLRLLGVV